MQIVSKNEKTFATTQMNQPTKSIVPTLLRASSIVVVFVGSLFSWLFKDGLGPDSVASTGFASFMRFLEGFWPFGAVAVFFVVISFFVRGTNKRNA